MNSGVAQFFSREPASGRAASRNEAYVLLYAQEADVCVAVR